MRALVGPLNAQAHPAHIAALRAADARCFDRSSADIAFDPAHESLDVLWSRLPQGWRPDCLVWWSPEYSLVPDRIERCPVPSIAVLGDWNLGLWTTAPLLEAFDWVVTDACGVRLLGPQLSVPVDRWPSYSFDPRLHRRQPGVERDIDVLFVGNMNADVQIDRAAWLGRLARLAPRFRVLIAAGVYGEDYAALLNRARIVWNRSIRGEMNMRAYEAPACGALLFLEEGNLEIKDVFTDADSCVLYDDANLESLLERYLTDRALLDRVTDAGWRRVQDETHDRHLARLLTGASRLEVGARSFASLPEWRRDFWLGLHALATPDPAAIAAALRHLGRALALASEQPVLAATLGALSATKAGGETGRDRDDALRLARQFFDVAVRKRPDDVVTLANLGWLSTLLGDSEVARGQFDQARTFLRSGATFPVDRIPMPFGFDRFRVEWERAAVAPDPDTRARNFAPLLDARLAVWSAPHVSTPDGRVAALTESVLAAPGVDNNVRELALALEAAGHVDAALVGHLHVLEGNPFDRDSRLAAARLAHATRDFATLERVLGDARRMAIAAPACQSLLADLDSTVLGPAVGEPIGAG